MGDCSSQLSGEGESPSNAENEEVGGQVKRPDGSESVRELSDLDRIVAMWMRAHPDWGAGRIWQHVGEADRIADVSAAMARIRATPGGAA